MAGSASAPITHGADSASAPITHGAGSASAPITHGASERTGVAVWGQSEGSSLGVSLLGRANGRLRAPLAVVCQVPTVRSLVGRVKGSLGLSASG